MRMIFLGLVPAALFAVPALAQPAQPFDGAFVGAQAGWQQDRQTLEIGNASGSESKDGLGYGGQIGYDFRLSPSTVFGIEAALTGRTGESFIDDGFTVFRLTQGRTISTTARLGVLTDPQGLAYVRGGYANARFNLDDGGPLTVSEDRDGWTLGAGYERYITPNVSARLEYGYSDFGRDRLTQAADLKYQRHAVTAGVNFRF
ncbi:MAG: outer membrane protein [Polymorphobacter sp.]|uniref:outer membrane protein n=1 Tax=Polymorphobacter sp. TaxID=1909290 RepID=UPI003A88B20D